uniref:Pre-mRNA-splicing factor SYF2 n=1 Tax=Urocitellus parryii TaxID=9999 RepID=A0A8D2IGS9_UROPR
AGDVAQVVVPVDRAEEGLRTAAEELAAQKREQRLRKFRELHLKRNEARKLNHQEVVEEDKRLKLPANWEAKKARLEWELQEEEKKKECAARGEDYEKVKLLEISAEDAERWERKKKRKNPDLGFSDYAAAQLRQYHRLTKQIKPDMETYERLREKHGEEFFPTSNSLLHGTHVPSTEEIDRMVLDLEKHLERGVAPRAERLWRPADPGRPPWQLRGRLLLLLNKFMTSAWFNFRIDVSRLND